MVNRHFIKMLALFTGILLVGFMVLYVAGKDSTSANLASVLDNILGYFGKE